MIPPQHAPRIWLSDSLIWMEFNTSKSDKTHTVHFPLSEDGLALALDILKARGRDSKIASRGSPIQHDVEKLVRDFKAKGGKVVKRTGEKFSVEQRSNARDVMRGLGLL